MSLPPNYISQTPRDHTQETFPPPLYLHWHHAGGALPSLTLPSHLSHPLIHLPPLCAVSLPPTTHHFAPSNYNSIHQSFAVTMATAMLGTGPCVARGHQSATRGHQSATDHHHLLHQHKVNKLLFTWLMDTQRDGFVGRKLEITFRTLDSIMA